MDNKIVHLGDYVDLRPIDRADNLARCINAARELMTSLNREDRLIFLSTLQADDACDYGGRNACHGNAMKRAAETFALTVWEICKTFPPPGEEPFA